MVAFKFRLTEEEYYQYNYYTAWASPGKKTFRAWYFLRVLLLYAAVALLYIIASRNHNFWVDISVFLITGFVYLFLVPVFVKRSVRKRVKDILSKKENQHVLDESEIVLSSTGIIDKDTLSESRYAWDAIVLFADTPESYYLYTNSYHAIVIPKRVIKTEEEQKETERLLNKHLPLQA